MKAEEVMIGCRTFYVIERRCGFCGYDSMHAVGGVIPAGTKPDVIRDTFEACRDALKVRVRMEKMLYKGMSESQAAMEIIFGN